MKASYDALAEIFECIEGFVRRLIIYTKIEQPTPAVTEVVIRIMVELISVLALATKEINSGRLSKSPSPITSHSLNFAEIYVKNFLGENKIKSVLQHIDRLTLEESKTTVTQTLEIVSSLIKKMEVVMEGARRLLM